MDMEHGTWNMDMDMDTHKEMMNSMNMSMP